LNTKVFIGVPCASSIIKMQTASAIVGIVCTTKVPAGIKFIGDAVVTKARNMLVEDALKFGATHIFFLDADIDVEPQVIDKLLLHEKMVVGANYHAKKMPIESVTKIEDENGIPISAPVPGQLFECGGLGAGAMLVNMDVFKSLKFPWFNLDYEPSGELISEDIYFCRKARKAGFSIWCDPTIQIWHVGDYEY
jgi:hypothetical protein